MLILLIWVLCSTVFIAFGIHAYRAKEAVSFYANVNTRPQVSDVSSYNHAVGKLWMVFGVIFLPLGLPLLAGQNSLWALVSIFGIIGLCFGLILVYVIAIEGKYVIRK